MKNATNVSGKLFFAKETVKRHRGDRKKNIHNEVLMKPKSRILFFFNQRRLNQPPKFMHLPDGGHGNKCVSCLSVVSSRVCRTPRIITPSTMN